VKKRGSYWAFSDNTDTRGAAEDNYVPPPPEVLPELMAGLSKSVARLATNEPLAHAAVASFGFGFHQPFEDGNGRLHRYLLHDFMTRSRVLPGGLALPVSAAMLDDMRGYDDT
jgi:Fic family protein